MPKINGEHTEVVYQRISAIINLYLDDERYIQKGWNEEFVKIIMTKFNIAKRTARRHIAIARKQYMEVLNKNTEEAMKLAASRLENIYQNAKRDKDYKLALEVLKETNKIYGLYEQKIDIKLSGEVNTKDLSELTTEELKAIARVYREAQEESSGEGLS